MPSIHLRGLSHATPLVLVTHDETLAAAVATSTWAVAAGRVVATDGSRSGTGEAP